MPTQSNSSRRPVASATAERRPGESSAVGPDGNRFRLAAVIPTFDRAAVIARAIDSALDQARRPDEIIIVDDGSSDDTREVVGSYGADVAYVSKENGGVSSARNLGVSRTNADFVAFLDSDDYWSADHLLRIEDAIDATAGQAGLYFSDLRQTPSRGGGSVWGRSGFAIQGGHEIEQNGRRWAFLRTQPMTIQASVVRRDIFFSIGGFDERLVCREDTDLFFRLALAAPVCAVAGCAGTLTGDSEASLSESFGPAHATYLDCTVRLYGGLLETFDSDLTEEERRILSRRLADAHWGHARGWGPRSPRRLLHHLGRGIRHDPMLVARHLSRRMSSSSDEYLGN